MAILPAVGTMASTEKISVSIDSDELAWLRKRAARRGGNLSSVVTEAARLLRQQEARQAVLRRLGRASDITPDEAVAILEEWSD